MTKEFVQQAMQDAESGHDYNHINRVYKLSKRILLSESTANPSLDPLVVKLGALLHDVDDWKFTSEENPNKVDTFLQCLPKDMISTI